MKKYLMKFMALSVAAILSISMLAGCGSGDDKANTSPDSEQTETSNVTEEKQEQLTGTSEEATDIEQ